MTKFDFVTKFVLNQAIVTHGLKGHNVAEEALDAWNVLHAECEERYNKIEPVATVAPTPPIPTEARRLNSSELARYRADIEKARQAGSDVPNILNYGEAVE